MPEYYERVKKKGIITPALVSELYGIEIEKITVVYCDVALAIKIAFPRPVPAGDIGNTDVFGAQQHAPLLGVEV